MASYTINDAGFRYQSEKIYYKLDTPYTGSINDKINVQGVISERNVFLFADSSYSGAEDPIIDGNLNKRVITYDASIG